MRDLLHLLAWSAVMVALFHSSPAWAQSTPNFEPSDDVRDSLEAAEWDHFFPIWGKKVVAKGFELPLPVGINIQYLYNYQGLDIGNLHLSVNDAPLVDFSDFVDVGQSSVATSSVQFRPDLWVLPFLNVYGLVGVGLNKIDVTVGKPVELQTAPDRDAFIYGFGGNASFAISRYFGVVDGNLTWAPVEGIDEPTRANVLSARIGRSFLLPREMRITGWIGFMRLGIESATAGSIRLGDVLPGLEDFFGDYQNSDWFQDLRPGQQQRVDELFAEIAARDPANTKINYALDKGLTSKWSMVFGGQYQFNPHWMFRWEYSHSEERGAILLNLNYRFGL